MKYSISYKILFCYLSSIYINSNRNSKSQNKGMMIVIALVFSFCLLILIVGMFFHHKNVAQHNRISIEQQQAFFAARAAIQHLLVKAKLFPTELYDAVEFTAGKNPLCDFTEFQGANNFALIQGFTNIYKRIKPQEEQDVNKKPKYFYIKLAGYDDIYIKIGSYYNPDYRFLAPNLAHPDPSKKYTTPKKPQDVYPDIKPDKYIKYYIRDCTNMSVDGKILQPALVMNIAVGIKNPNEWDILKSEGYPYTMQYKVNNISIQAMKELRRYNEEAIEIEVEGTIYNFKFDPTKPNLGGKFTQIQRKVQKITRRGSL